MFFPKYEEILNIKFNVKKNNYECHVTVSSKIVVGRPYSFDAGSGLDARRQKRSRWGAWRSRTADAGDLEIGEFQRRYRFSYEVADSAEPALKPLAPRSFFSFRSNSTVPNASHTTNERTFDFGTAFEFAPATIEDPEKMEEREKRAKRKGFEEDEEIPKAYASIFTYESAFTNDPAHLTDDEGGFSKKGGTPDIILLALSVFFLLLFFPIMVWFCVKRLSQHERLIIFRLGKRLGSKGPGYCLVLPFIDNFHIIDLEDQNIKIKPITGTTADEAQVEIGFSVLFRIIDPESAITIETKMPEDIIIKKTESSFVSAVSRLDWDDLKTGHALPDLANEIRASLNSYCGSHGIHINSITLDDLKTIKDPPPITDKIKRLNFTQIGQQIANLSPLLMGGGIGSGGGSTGVPSVPPMVTQFTDMIARIASMKKTSTDDVDSKAIPNDSQTSVELSTPAEDLVRLDQIIGGALNRAQIFLDNAAARQALGGTSMQVFIYRSDVNNTGEHLATFYMDSSTGKSGRGLMPGPELTSVSVHMTSGDFAETILGRLDVLDLVKKSKIRISGDLMSLAKLRFLLQFK